MANRFSIYHGRKTQILLNVSFLGLFIFYLATLLSPSPPLEFSLKQAQPSDDIQDQSCTSIHKHKDHATSCSYIKSHKSCNSQGYIDYLAIFYCYCGKHPTLGYILFAAWLLILFYLLGNTASEYFCTSLEDLATLLGLSPTIAGVTLLSLGNGAPDVFSSIASFVSAGGGEVGLNSVLGGAFVVSSGVAGIVAISVSSSGVSIHRSSFIRDACFFLVTIASLLVVLVVGRINLWSALGFTTIYVVYVSVVYLSDYLHRKREVAILLFDEENGGLKAPLLAADDEIKTHPPATTSADGGVRNWFSRSKPLALQIGAALLIPLSLPRRLTIPVVSKERWSKLFAVCSAFLSPVFLAAIWGPKGLEARLTVYGIGCGVGLVLGLAAWILTEVSHPPARFVFPWLVGGFCMSMAWTYIIAEELVALLVALGKIIGISPTILGLTVLAWGNSISDLIANVALAVNGGRAGAQTAMSGCYAGPMFNTLVGLGVPFVLRAWSSYPDSFVVPQDPTLYVTLAFLAGGLLWALVLLPGRGMMLDKFVGIGLLAIYLCFLSLRFFQALGVLRLHHGKDHE
ncbi:Cation/calcium exchanger 1 [Nymphaea thermarum]|nr:Cation/calcium exchanger 1 [Nymphaea thermarum]